MRLPVWQFIGPLALALTYGEANRAVLVLCVCGAISLGAAILYLPLPSLMPAPAPKSEELLGMEEYEKMKHAQFMQLPLATRWRIDQQRTKDGKPPIMHGWGKYDEQRGLLAGLVERSQDDFQFLKAQLIQNLTNQEKLETFRSQINSSRAKTRARSGWFDRHTKDQEEMGRWLGECARRAALAVWGGGIRPLACLANTDPPPLTVSRADFDDAGYEGWKVRPTPAAPADASHQKPSSHPALPPAARCPLSLRKRSRGDARAHDMRSASTGHSHHRSTRLMSPLDHARSSTPSCSRRWS